MTVKELRQAIKGLPDETPVDLFLDNDPPEGWDVRLLGIAPMHGDWVSLKVMIEFVPPGEEEEDEE